jgi:hypothetical protein
VNMRSLGAIVIGIGAYRYDRGEFPMLLYASNDADEITRYLTTCWHSEERTLVRIPEADATVAAITQAFDNLKEEGPYDLLFVFLSGHGFVDGRHAGFVTQPPPGSSALSLLDFVSLDQLLASVAATRTILILDCCKAEGIVRRMGFFSGLAESDARFFIASSREQQLTWEDERIGHGIFTAHLLDLLNTGSSVNLHGVRDQLNVDSELFPILCDQVPLYVLEHKQQRQEPVKGGVSIRAISLPVARAARRIKERTAFGTAIRRLRQIVTTIAIACMAFLFFAYTLGYYAQADRNGDIRLHNGTKWLAPIFRFLPTLRVETGISSSDLSQDPATRYAVQAGETSGFWTHISTRGYRAWYEDNVRPSLDPTAAARYDVLLAAGEMRPVYRLNEESRPSEVAFAAWALLDSSDPKQLAMLFGHMLGAGLTHPLLSRFSATDMDFGILDQTPSELASYADALRATAAVDPDRTFIPYVGFLKANQMWLAYTSAEQHGEESQRRAVDDVADILSVIVKARTDRGEPGLDPNMLSVLNKLSELGYSGLVYPALSRAAVTPVDKKSAALLAFSAFHGHSHELAESTALREIKDTLDSSPASQAIVAEVYNRFVAVGGPEQTDLTAFLIAAADKKALPPSVMTILLTKAQEAVARRDGKFMDLEYARILAHGMSQVPVPSRPLVYRLIDLVVSTVTPISSFTAEMYCALGRQRLDTPAIFQRIVAEASAAPPYQPQNPALVAEPLPGMSIVVGYGPWLEALAVIGAERPLSPQAISILESHANDPTLREIIFRALLHQPAWNNQQCWKASCNATLKAFPENAVRRQLTSDLLAEKLSTLPRGAFLPALEELRKERASETEPEVRIALGLATINAQLARVRTTPVGSQLFE